MKTRIHKLLSELSSDHKAGSFQRQGRNFFRQRQVVFQTISIEAADLYQGGWLDYQNIAPPDFNTASDEQILAFARDCSERFIDFWYRIFDIMAARALFGGRTEIFQKPFFYGNSFIDIGIPEQTELSSVPISIHRPAISQYHQSKGLKSDHYAIYYLSDYLEGLTDDMIEWLKPYQRLWELENRRKRIIIYLEKYRQRFQKEESIKKIDIALIDLIQTYATTLRRKNSRNDSLSLTRVRNTHFRKLVHRFSEWANENTDVYKFTINEEDRKLIFADLPEGLSDSARSTYLAYRLPEKLYETTRSAIMYLTQARRYTLRQERFLYFHPDRKPSDILAEQTSSNFKKFQTRAREIQNLIGAVGLRKQYQKFYQMITSIEKIDNLIIDLYKNQRSSSTRGHPAAENSLQAGNPYHMQAILNQAREIIRLRLRPVRSTANDYSTLPGERHGALSLNPVLRLWKDRPWPSRGPAITEFELNTRHTIECLLNLMTTVIPFHDYSFELERGRILKEKLGSENLSNIKFFLLPGSCSAIREVSVFDFPEFRKTIIGDFRSPDRVGVKTSDAILTGAWYKKQNHCLYYTVGADNASLLHTIYNSGRNANPAFFFAIGQFIHDCLPDNLIYYSSGRATFRQNLENYYRLEDKVRKNRGERTGRRKIDNSRPGVRFMFSIFFSRLLLEILTGSAQYNLRFPPLEKWIAENTGLPLLREAEPSKRKEIRQNIRQIIEDFSLSVNEKRNIN